MKVWTYWDGRLWPHIEVCLASMQAFCDVTVLNSENADDFIQGVLPAQWRALKEPAHRADCVRAAILAQHGGLYLDADTLVLRKIPVDLFARKDMVCFAWDKNPFRVSNGCISARTGSRIARAWLEKVVEFLESFQKPEWTILGESILTPLVTALPNDYVPVPRSVFFPIDVDSEPQRFFTTEDYRPLIYPWTVAFGLNHSYMTANYAREMSKTIAEMQRSNLLIHRLLCDVHKSL